MYADYCEALELAVEYTREKTSDPEFSLGIDPYADVSTLSQKKATPNHSDKSRTPHSGSQVKRSSMHSSTGGKTAESEPKSVATVSLSTSKKGKNGCVIDPTANSPVLADDPQHSSEGMKLESSKRKRSRDSLNTEGDERATAETKRQRTNADESEDLSQSGKKEEGGGERGKEVVPRKLDFYDDEAMDGEGASGSVQEEPPHSVQTEPPDSSQEGPSTCAEQGPPDSSPVSKAEHRPSSPCGGSLSNGLPSELPSLDSVEDSKGEPVEGSREEEEQRHRVAERGETGGLSCSSKTRSEDDDDDVMSTEAGEGSASGELSDSDDDSMPTFSCKVKEDLTCKLSHTITCLHVFKCVHAYTVDVHVYMYVSCPFLSSYLIICRYNVHVVPAAYLYQFMLLPFDVVCG